MFDLSASASIRNSLNISAVSGSLQKSHPKSFFVNFQYGSQLSKQLLKANPTYVLAREGAGYASENTVVILQIMNSFGDYVVAEVVLTSDFMGAVKNV